MSVDSFLEQYDWHNADINWFGADWSVRRYARLTKNNGETAILLHSLPDDHPDAMIGHLLEPWVEVNKHFTTLGLSVPAIYACDLSQGLMLIEDFGDETMVGHGFAAYEQATHILITMRDHPQALKGDFIRYEESHVYRALRFFPRYVVEGDEAEWFAAWKDVETALPLCPRALTHMDYHPGNLMWQNKKIGIIDFQAACNGPFVYDIVNLLEDIRIDVPQNIKDHCKTIYCATLSPKDQDLFTQWYPVITAQFHARILGQIRYLSQDKGRDDLLKYYDPLMKRFETEIKHPYLKPIRDLIND